MFPLFCSKKEGKQIDQLGLYKNFMFRYKKDPFFVDCRRRLPTVWSHTRASLMTHLCDHNPYVHKASSYRTPAANFFARVGAILESKVLQATWGFCIFQLEFMSVSNWNIANFRQMLPTSTYWRQTGPRWWDTPPWVGQPTRGWLRKRW